MELDVNTIDELKKEIALLKRKLEPDELACGNLKNRVEILSLL